MDRFSSVRLLNFLCIFPLVSTRIKYNKYVLTQPYGMATYSTCVLQDICVDKRRSPKIWCGAECNKNYYCTFYDILSGDLSRCRLVAGFKTLRVSPGNSTSDQFVRFKKLDSYYTSIATGRDSLCTVTLTTGRTLPALCHYGEYNWTIIQRRLDGSVNFQRNWKDYENGFGTLDSEFWIGNKNLHDLTSDGLTYLRIELMKHTCWWRYADYGTFVVKDANDKYRLIVSSYSGNAGDSLTFHNNSQFSTYDRDHDSSVGTDCAKQSKGGWWFAACLRTNLNGEYAAIKMLEGIIWQAWMGFSYSMTEVRMMLRRP